MGKEETSERVLNEDELKEETKKLSIKEGVSYSIMDGAGLKYISPYALALGANNNQIGLLTSVPALIGNFSQLFTSKFMEKYSRKKVIIWGAFLQAIMWLPLILVGYLYFNKNLSTSLSAWLIIAFYTLITFFGSFSNPAWNSLMKDVVDKESGKYFGKRNKITGIAVLLVMLGSGLVLDLFKENGDIFFGFVILLAISFVSRTVSAKILSKHYDPNLELKEGYYFSFVDFLKKFRKNNFGKFTLFVSLINLATYIASPFFTVYMLKDLNLNYLTYTLITLSSPLSNLLFMPLWGRIADRFGNLRVLKRTALLIPLVPFLWFLTFFMGHLNSTALIAYLLAVEFMSGMVWAGFNLSSATFIYDAVTKQRVAICVAYYNILNGIGTFIGATIGGFISSLKINLFGMDAILLIFLISALARFLVYLLMAYKIKEVRPVEEYKRGAFRKEFKNELNSILLPPNWKFGIFSIKQEKS